MKTLKKVITKIYEMMKNHEYNVECDSMSSPNDYLITMFNQMSLAKKENEL